jgi:aldose 1-epimerase
VDLAVEYLLDDSGLSVTQYVTNLGAICPYAAGAHPYLSPGPGGMSDAVLCIPAATRLLTDDRQIPVGREPVAGTPFDFREPRAVGDAVLDTAYTDIVRDAGGRAAFTLRWSRPNSGVAGVELWMDATYDYAMVFTGDTLAPPRRRQGLAVEPMTAAPDAFNSGDGLRRLAPGERFGSSWGIRPLR